MRKMVFGITLLVMLATCSAAMANTLSIKQAKRQIVSAQPSNQLRPRVHDCHKLSSGVVACDVIQRGVCTLKPNVRCHILVNNYRNLVLNCEISENQNVPCTWYRDIGTVYVISTSKKTYVWAADIWNGKSSPLIVRAND